MSYVSCLQELKKLGAMLVYDAATGKDIGIESAIYFAGTEVQDPVYCFDDVTLQIFNLQTDGSRQSKPVAQGLYKARNGHGV